MKTPEELADEYINACLYEYCKGNNAINNRQFFLAGYAAANRWISVEEELPERDGEYLVSSQYGKTSKPLLSILRVATFSTSNESRINTEGFLYTDGSIDFNVTHWMPLPPIPNE